MHVLMHVHISNQDVGTDELWPEYIDWATQGVLRFVHNYEK